MMNKKKKIIAWLSTIGGGIASVLGVLGATCVVCTPICGALCISGPLAVIAGVGIAGFLGKYHLIFVAIGIIFLLLGIILLFKYKQRYKRRNDTIGNTTLMEDNQDGISRNNFGTVLPVLGTCGSSQGRAPVGAPRLNQPFVLGSVNIHAKVIPQISCTLTCSDKWGACKVRWDIDRMDYKVDPGLYALGHPDDKSPVLVTANYKLSFDHLREALPERSVWVLVLDTEGINVWCAAGKGTFGTEEVVRRVESSGLAHIVSHRELILPQLAAPGVAAHQVKKLSGFKVIYGPIRSKDLPIFLDNGLEATPAMRMKTFITRERAVLIPVELAGAIKPGLLIMAVFFLLGGLGEPGPFWTNALNYGLFAVFCLLAALCAGGLLTPLLLPWLPGRAFSLKGLSMGLITAGILSFFRWDELATLQGRLEMAGWFFLVSAISAYVAMNFTGASTYTSLSGVKKEMRWAVPVQIAGAVVGFGLWLGSRFGT